MTERENADTFALRWAPVADTPRAAVLPVFDAAWKARCQRCAHFASVKTGDELLMQCRAVHAGPRLMFCGNARADDGKCGPSATLWDPLP
jgi:hypothetical protein